VPERKKILFIINKFSGGGFSPSIEGRIIDECAKVNVECTIEFTNGRGHATELAKKGSQENLFQTVFAVGGDGTVNEVAQGLVGTKIVMGILPNGSGNGLARHLGIPIDFKKSLSLINSTNSISMDTFSVNGMLSVNVSGIGFDGHVASQFGKNGKRGLIGYSKLVIKEFVSFKEFPVEVELDGKKYLKEAFIVALANSSQFGNNARVAPQASVCDELIDVCFVKKVPLHRAVDFGYQMFSGQLNKSSFVEIIQAKNIQLKFKEPIAFHIDGEAHPSTELINVQMQPASLRMLLTDNPQIVQFKKRTV
jgi:diacylglycerol kinase (ATP)